MAIFDRVGSLIQVTNSHSSTLAGTNPDISMDRNGNFVVVWTHFFSSNDSDIYFRRFDRNGRPVGLVQQAANSSSNEAAPAVAMDPNGNFVITYSVNGNIVIKRYDSNSNSTFTRTIDHSSDLYDSDVAIDNEGDFAVVFTDRVSSSDSDIRGYTYHSDGTPAVSNIDITGTGSGDGLSEESPSIAARPINNDNLSPLALAGMVTWTTTTSSSSGFRSVAYRKFGNEGNALGLATYINSPLINNTTVAATVEPSISVNESGDFAIAYRSRLDYDIYTQLNNGSPVLVDNRTGDEPDVIITNDDSISVAYEFDFRDGYMKQGSDSPMSLGIEFPKVAISHNNDRLAVVGDRIVDGKNQPFVQIFNNSQSVSGVSSSNDLNQDGKADILVHNPNRSWSATWLMNGSSYSNWAGLPAWSGWRPVGMGDFNSDGQTDILINHRNNRWNGVWFMNGTNYSSYANIGAGGWYGWNVTTAGDFNKDGQADLVAHNPDSDWNVVWLTNGANVTGWFSLPLWNGWEPVGSGDFNKDGNLDVLVSNPTQGLNAVWYTNGSSYTGQQGLYSWGSAWQAVGAGDFNQDGNTDMLMSNPSQGWNGIALMNGTTPSGWAGLPSWSGWEIAG